MGLSAFHLMTYPFGVRGRTPQPALHAVEDVVPETWAATPVILVHGYVHNRSAFLVMSRALRRAGLYHVHGLNFNPLRMRIAELAERLAAEVDHVLRATGSDRCVLVGHSMGGIVARLYAQDLAPAGVVDTVITLGSPHRGTYTAYLALGPAAVELRPRSVLMRRLEETARPSATRWISYYSDLDLMITPAEHGRLVHPALRATNIRLADTGHSSLLLSGEAIGSIVAHLTDPHLGRRRPSADRSADPRPSRPGVRVRS